MKTGVFKTLGRLVRAAAQRAPSAEESAGAAAAALFEEVRPRDDVRVLLEQCPALALSHAAPDPELDLVVQRVRPALLHYRAVTADHRRLALGGPPNKQLIGVSGPTQCL